MSVIKNWLKISQNKRMDWKQGKEFSQQYKYKYKILDINLVRWIIQINRQLTAKY